MKTIKMMARYEVKKLIIKRAGIEIRNEDITEIMQKINCNMMDVVNAINYFKYSPQAQKYRQ